MRHKDLVAYFLAIEKLQPRFEAGNYETADVEKQVRGLCQITSEAARHAVDEAVAEIIFEQAKERLLNNRVLSRALMEARSHLTLREADRLLYKARLDAMEN